MRVTYTHFAVCDVQRVFLGDVGDARGRRLEVVVALDDLLRPVRDGHVAHQLLRIVRVGRQPQKLVTLRTIMKGVEEYVGRSKPEVSVSFFTKHPRTMKKVVVAQPASPFFSENQSDSINIP